MQNVLRIFFSFSAVLICFGTAQMGLARRIELSLDEALLQRAKLQYPTSASLLNLEKRTADELVGLCPLMGFGLIPERKVGSENISRSLKIRFKNGIPEVDECLRNNICNQASHSRLQESKSGAKSFSFEGLVGKYRIDIESNLNLPSKPVICKSSAVEILESSKGELKLPSTLWVLNYRNEVVLWDGTQSRVWFRFKFPTNQTLGETHTAVIDANGRLLVSDRGNNFMLADFQSDKGLLKTDAGIFESYWGLGSARYSGEWHPLHLSPNPFAKDAELLSNKNLSPYFFGISGYARGEHFWSWETIFSLARGKNAEPLDLTGNLITGSELINGDLFSAILAVRSDAGTAKLFEFEVGAKSLRMIKEGLRIDARAQANHFILLGKELYRHTADGVYKVDSSSETPSNLKGFKGSFEARGHFTVSKERHQKNCSLTLYSNNQTFSNIITPQLSGLACHFEQGVGISPWGHSISWKTGQQIKTILSTND